MPLSNNSRCKPIESIRRALAVESITRTNNEFLPFIFIIKAVAIISCFTVGRLNPLSSMFRVTDRPAFFFMRLAQDRWCS
ncbi:AAEL016961-PA [Aedes aegypti]|uniref:AAEL016961-PA n=1 Tax=Aedes aegypti TaxID=7159 RepID=J9EBM3_AEDAE|nr:AAEL016961-PA [Aedes aegypti]